MLALGDIWIEADEVLRIGLRGVRLFLVLAWPLEEVPVLVGLPEEVLLRWHEGEDPTAGLPVRPVAWTYRGNGGSEQEVRITLCLRGVTSASPEETGLGELSFDRA